MEHSHSQSYADAGVDITAGYEATRRMKAHVERTRTAGVLGGLGGFGGMFAPNLSGMARPVLVSGADGVGTKLRIAFLMDRHDSVGIDCVAMCVNDILCAGAAPLFFLDYIASGGADPAKTEAIVAGVAEGCVRAGCALVGGETAEMPGHYAPGEYDLAGFAVGMADEAALLRAENVKAGDVLLALPSSGLHSNGFSLVRRAFGVEANPAALGRHEAELGRDLGEELLEPTRIYVKPVLALLKAVKVKGLCHITGGGWFENIPRMLPEGLCAKMDTARLETPPIFELLARAGNIPRRDMFNTFNMGLGMVAAVAPKDESAALAALAGEGLCAYAIGEVAAGEEGVVLA